MKFLLKTINKANGIHDQLLNFMQNDRNEYFEQLSV